MIIYKNSAKKLSHSELNVTKKVSCKSYLYIHVGQWFGQIQSTLYLNSISKNLKAHDKLKKGFVFGMQFCCHMTFP